VVRPQEATRRVTDIRTHERVLAHLETELASGRLGVGDRLPAERAMAEQLSVSRPSVREALRVLEAMGVIKTAVGSGPDAGASVVADTSAGISAALRLHLASSALPVSDLVQTRILLESWSVGAAARAGDQPLLAAADGLLAAMDDEALPREEFLLLDAQFHVTLALSAGNTVVAAIMTSLRVAIHDYVLKSAAVLPDWPTTAKQLRREHRAILASIRAGDDTKAARRVVRHIEGFYRSTRIS
jgi:GntR family transcriptional repressor for pyruvate dehydrogenase complex